MAKKRFGFLGFERAGELGQETTFKNWFRDQYGGWSEVYEPRRGSGVGMPDVQILWKPDGSTNPQLLPIEMKVGKIEGGRLFVERVEPAQPSWHLRFWEAGGYSVFLVGVPIYSGSKIVGWTPWQPLLFADNIERLMNWRDGWELDMCIVWDYWGKS